MKYSVLILSLVVVFLLVTPSRGGRNVRKSSKRVMNAQKTRENTQNAQQQAETTRENMLRTIIAQHPEYLETMQKVRAGELGYDSPEFQEMMEVIGPYMPQMTEAQAQAEAAARQPQQEE